MTALQWFRFFAPEYSALPDSDVQTLLDAAELFVYAPCLDQTRLDAATALYAAHLKYLQNQSAAGEGYRGPVKSEREGDLARSYGVVSGSTTWLGNSPYGMQYIDVTAPCFGSGIMTRYGDMPPIGPFALEGNSYPYIPVVS